MTSEVLASVAGVILSLLFTYIPGLNTKFAGLTSQAKSLIMLGLLALIAGGAYGLACWGVLNDLFGVSLTCDKAGAIQLIKVFFFAVMANVGTYVIAPQPQKVIEAKENR